MPGISIPILLGLIMKYTMDLNKVSILLGVIFLYGMAYALSIYICCMNSDEKFLVQSVLKKITGKLYGKKNG
jgi:hypothetical protein